MRLAPLLLLLLLISACSFERPAAANVLEEGVAAAARKPVLLELFTSEGCSSCPPAERNLAYLQTEQPYPEAEIITLAFHVDYWDGLGWKDPFASPLFTQRHRVYDRKFRTGNIYTPQMVVDGDYEFVGSKLDKAEKAIVRSVRNEKGVVDLSLADGRLSIDITKLPEIEYASVYLAYAEDGLSSEIERGENAGRTLSHVAVVRALQGLGRIEPGSSSFRIETVLNVDSTWRMDALKAVVFVQENHTRKIFGVSSIRLSGDGPVAP